MAQGDRENINGLLALFRKCKVAKHQTDSRQKYNFYTIHRCSDRKSRGSFSASHILEQTKSDFYLEPFVLWTKPKTISHDHQVANPFALWTRLLLYYMKTNKVIERIKSKVLCLILVHFWCVICKCISVVYSRGFLQQNIQNRQIACTVVPKTSECARNITCCQIRFPGYWF